MTSDLRNETLQEIFTQLPTDLQAVIKEVNKESWPGSNSDPAIETVDKLWLFSEFEITGETGATSYADGVQYEYWKTIKDGSNDRDTVKTSDGDKVNWWLRSSGRGSSSSYVIITYSGGAGFYHAGNRAGVSFGFCV